MPESKDTALVRFLVKGEEMASLLLSPKTFSTGSQGYFASGKLSPGDGAEKGDQGQVQRVRSGSKEAKAAQG